MTTINIVGYDTWYSERPWCRGLDLSRPFEVVHDKPKNNNITYFIRDGIYQVDEVESRIKVALLTECRPFDVQDRYVFVEDNRDKFDYIVSYDDQLALKCPDKICPTPEGGTWVWPQEKQQVYKKSKLCSYVVSNKNETQEQKMRVELLRILSENKTEIGLFGRGHNPFPEDHDNDYDGKSNILKDYAFSITIENWIQDNYFSEKIMDCFMVGTVPIYFGAREIGKYFNSNGIITVESIEDVMRVLQDLSFDKYQKMLPFVQENFERAKNHIDTVSYSFLKYIEPNLKYKLQEEI